MIRRDSLGTVWASRWTSVALCRLAAVSAVAVVAWNRSIAAEPSSVPPPSAVPRVADVAIYPDSIRLDTARDFQSFIAVLKQPDGVTSDVTGQTQWNIADESIARMNGRRIEPLADGATELVGRYFDREVRIPVTVNNAAVRPAISFTKDVMPVLTRSGCNTGSCHGAARGKDGFNLSLFGFDPVGDYHRITREMGTRRINLAVPSESLLISKAIGAVPHSGGKLFATETPEHATMLEWLSDGAPADDPAAMPPAVQSVSIFPPQAVIQGAGKTQQFVVVAHYADGTTRDVTSLAAFNSNNASTAQIDPSGLVTAGSRGEAFVMARFDTHTVGSQVLTLPEQIQYTPPQPQPSGYIDELVDKKLMQLRIPPSESCSDAEFIRRVTIDIVGQLPAIDEVARFTQDVAPDKRSALIETLLGRREFNEIWAMKFAQLLMIKSTNEVSYKSAFLYAKWLTDQFAADVPIDQMVRQLLTSTGGTFSQPSSNFYQIERDPLKMAENVAQVFTGIRLQCAQCHNHPFDRWTMDDYYGFAAFFSQIGRKQAEDYRELLIFNSQGGETRHPVTGQVVPPKFLGGDAPDTQGKDRREVLANWLTTAENPYFSKSIANRVWAHFMGVGLVDQVDDIRISNPASNPELLDALGDKFAEYSFDFRSLVRDICNSRAYQRSSATLPDNSHDHRNYAHAVIRRIPAETLLDCISQVTARPDKFRGLPLGARATQIADGTTSNYFLTTFGRSPRATVCECEATTAPSLSQALHLINGDSVHGKINAGRMVETWLAEANATPETVINNIYLAALARTPDAQELDQLNQIVASAPDPTTGLQDVFWAVLNSREFVFNH